MRGLTSAVAFFLALMCVPLASSAQLPPSNGAKPAIVLVHGAWADSSSWNGVIAQLQAGGYTVYAPPNTLRNLASDAATIATFVKAIPGPVILVGHSYGGAVISVASANAPNVRALVYVDAFVPDSGETLTALLSPYPAPPKDFLTAIPFAGGGDADLYITQKYYGAVFASDVPPDRAAVLAAGERPLAASTFNEKAPAAEGWKTIPSWYVIGDADLVIPPPLQLMMAQRAKSHISHVNGSHPSMIMHPEATVAAIMAAIQGTK
jgi:pimeloyl-ACP methyl ester carboxylesterase